MQEVIVVDDGSTDGSLNNLSQQFPSAKFFFQENQGVSAARNHGIRKAKGRWIALLECVHNVNTWEMNEWIGLGPSACSQFNGKRWKNPSNLEKWAEGVSNGFSPKDYDEFQVMTLTGFAEDALLFGLRMNDGVCLSTLGERFHLSSDYLDEVRDFVSKLQAEGLAVKNEQRIMLTLQGRVRADAIAVEMPEYQIG